MHDTQTLRYEAARHNEDGDFSPVPMFVYDGSEYQHPRGYQARSYIGPKFTPAEAAIIAFALNAVHEGHLLTAVHFDTLEHLEVSDTRYDMYDGPTEGVRRA